jgi:hypothetical protein
MDFLIPSTQARSQGGVTAEVTLPPLNRSILKSYKGKNSS